MNTTSAHPRPIVHRMRWPFPLIWLVPLIALIVSGFFLWQYRNLRGPEITIHLQNADGLKLNETPVRLRGVTVGKVMDLVIPDQGEGVDVVVRLGRHHSSLATKGTLFWIVRPDFSAGNLSGLASVVSGPHIEAYPSKTPGEPQLRFEGLDRTPVTTEEGRRYIIHAPQLGALQPGTPINYRGVQVGTIEEAQLADNATHVRVTIFIQDRYTPLIRTNTRFWSVSGATVEGSIFSGVHARLDSIKSLVTGGLAFATPDDEVAPAAPEGHEFFLYDDPRKEWQDWTPRIPLPPPSK